MNNELKPCPFCGGEAISRPYSEDDFTIYCEDCKAEIGWREKEEATVAWNTRPDNWISVNERLPEANEDVLVVVDYGEKSGVITGYMRSQNLGWKGIVGQRLTDVTHWMPLPQPPKDNEPAPSANGTSSKQ